MAHTELRTVWNIMNPKKHQEVMELLKWAQQNKLIHCGIVEFIVSRQ